MAVTAAYERTAETISNTEKSLINGSTTLTANTTAGVYQLFVDGVANMVKGDEFQISVYETVRASGTMRLVFRAVLKNAQSEVFVTPALMLLQGWQMTMLRISASDRAFDTSIRKG